jgi:glycerophosphoryl diester phosphodiesterase
MIQLIQAKQSEVERIVGIYLKTKDPSYFRSIDLSLEESLVNILNQYGYNYVDSSLFIESFETNNFKLPSKCKNSFQKKKKLILYLIFSNPLV